MLSVLCIDDQAAALNIRKMLLETKGYSVSIAFSGQAGLDAIANGNFSAVVLDYSMPERDGEDIAHEIKLRWPELPVIMLSGYPEIPSSAMECADAFIVKGSPPAELLDTLERLTGEKPTPRVTSAVERSREIMTRTSELLDDMHRRNTLRRK